MSQILHRNIILNSKITYMGDRHAELDKSKLKSVHFIFTTETDGEIIEAIESFRLGRPLPSAEVRRVGRRKHNKK